MFHLSFLRKGLQRMNIYRLNKFLNFILLFFVIYAIITFCKQQVKLNSYSEAIAYYNQEIDNLNSKQEELLEIQSNVNSEEYIEKIAREELHMYLPNEIVYIDSNQ